MNMRLTHTEQIKNDYLAGIKSRREVNQGTYLDDVCARKSIIAISRTSRGHAVYDQKTAEIIWSGLKKLLPLTEKAWMTASAEGPVSSVTEREVGRLTEMQESELETAVKSNSASSAIPFDLWMLCVITRVSRLIAGSQPAIKGPLGSAQKTVNLVMKDLWALGLVPASFDPVLHMPLDARILSHLGNSSSHKSLWQSWTQVDFSVSNLWAYLQIQLLFRKYCESRTVFTCPLELEQIWWASVG